MLGVEVLVWLLMRPVGSTAKFSEKGWSLGSSWRVKGLVQGPTVRQLRVEGVGVSPSHPIFLCCMKILTYSLPNTGSPFLTSVPPKQNHWENTV